MTINEIKERTASTEPYFFSPNTMRLFGQKMSDFKVTEEEDGRFFISAPMIDSRGKVMGYTERYFNPETNRLEFE